MNDIAEWAIGVFDSGVGGLTVVKEIKNSLPQEKIIYLGDTARVPYGNRSPETVLRYSRENARFLMERGIKLLVVACNTASSIALPELKKRMPVEVIGVVEPGARSAVMKTKRGRIGVIGTEATIKSGSYTRAILKLDNKVRIFPMACPLFVPLVEEGMVEHKITYSVAEHYLAEFRKLKIDVLILGCTHYPVLKRVIQKTVGEKVTLVDSAEEVARDVERLLMAKGIKGNSKKGDNNIEYYVTDAPDKFIKLSKVFLNKKIPAVMRAELF